MSEQQRILLHVCCAPCSTYTINRLREQVWDVTGYWYNPNIHPFSEHERRRETLVQYAAQVNLPVQWEAGYDVIAFMRAIHEHEAMSERCLRCYRLRLEQTARVAAQGGFDAWSTTLLISPYQDQKAIQRIAQELGETYRIPFYFENFRRGWAERGRLTRQYNLYSQRYCGCLYSEWESIEKTRQRGQ